MNVANHLDLDWIRSQFPALSLEISGRPAVFLDAPGGTQVPQQVVSSVSAALVNANANTHGAFLTSQRADRVIAAAHQAAGAMPVPGSSSVSTKACSRSWTDRLLVMSMALEPEFAVGG